MGRPKRPFNGEEEISPSGDAWGRKAIPLDTLGIRQKRRWEASAHWVYPMPNGVYDPMTYMFVLDMLVGINDQITLRASKLAEYLRIKRPQMGWDAITVGKVLADIEEEFENVLGEKVGILEKGVDYRGKFYYIHLYPDAVRLYSAVREDLMKLVDDERQKRLLNEAVYRTESPFRECPSMRGEFQAIA